MQKNKIVSLYPLKMQEPHIVENPLRKWIITEKNCGVKAPTQKTSRWEKQRKKEAQQCLMSYDNLGDIYNG